MCWLTSNIPTKEMQPIITNVPRGAVRSVQHTTPSILIKWLTVRKEIWIDYKHIWETWIWEDIEQLTLPNRLEPKTSSPCWGSWKRPAFTNTRGRVISNHSHRIRFRIPLLVPQTMKFMHHRDRRKGKKSEKNERQWQHAHTRIVRLHFGHLADAFVQMRLAVRTFVTRETTTYHCRWTVVTVM